MKRFAAALTSDPVGTHVAVAAISKKADAMATTELAVSGPVDAEISSLAHRHVTLAAQQKAM